MNHHRKEPAMRVEATTASDGSAIVTVDGAPQKIIGTDLEDARAKVIALVREHAATVQEDVTLTSSDPEGVFTIVVAPGGEIRDPSAPEPAQARGADIDDHRLDAVDRQLSTAGTFAPSLPGFDAAPVTASFEATREARPSEQPATRREARQSFLTRTGVEEPARQGLRGILTRAGFKVAPSAAERSYREWVYSVSQHFVGPRTIMIANGKGGAGKTLATVCLSSVFARNGGAGVIAWDNNQTRGTLGWSTEQTRHEGSVLDLLPNVDRLLGVGAQSADMAQYVHHQTRDRYDVLRSKPDVVAAEQRFDAATVDQVHRVLTKFYRLVVIDSGNDETDPMWLAALDRTDQLVVPTTTDPKWCESASLLLERLSELGGRYQALAENAVILVSAETADVPAAVLEQRVAGFRERGVGRDILTIPHDKGLKAMVINYDALEEPTKRAWLAAGASIARGL
ncbi:AAA family ATPase [Clavibacter michiganensis]|uniref:AAA family ATPase n=1 Tax=Clavibacter michiganensis TaxID=28447 RepID=UPI00292D518D|nr:AAA family ATPase [Clavibacter michiganensis]